VIHVPLNAAGQCFGNGDDGGRSIADRLGIDAPPRLEILDSIDARALATFLKGEHPQTVALILAHLDGKKCNHDGKKS